MIRAVIPEVRRSGRRRWYHVLREICGDSLRVNLGWRSIPVHKKTRLIVSYYCDELFSNKVWDKVNSVNTSMSARRDTVTQSNPEPEPQLSKLILPNKDEDRDSSSQLWGQLLNSSPLGLNSRQESLTVSVMHLSILSPTPPSMGMGGALARDFMLNYVPRVGHLAWLNYSVWCLVHVIQAT